MPQFDLATFFVQAFWLVVGFLTFYLVYLKFILVNTFTVLRAREKLLAFSLKVNTKLSSSKVATKMVALV